MVATPLSPDVRALLDEPNFAHLATLMPDGSPQSAPVWVGVEGDSVAVATGEGSLKATNTRRDPRVSLFPMRANPEQRVVLVVEVQRARYTVLPFSHTPRITGGLRPSEA
jgi:hypothetical protein